MTARNQLICLWSGYAFFVLYLLGIVVVAGFIPPPAPSLSGEAVAAFFDSTPWADFGRHVHLRVRVGAVCPVGGRDSRRNAAHGEGHGSRR